MKTKIALIAILAGGVLGALAALGVLPVIQRWGVRPGQMQVAFAAEIKAEARSVTVDSETFGEVVVNGQPAIRIRTSVEGLTPLDRASVVAGRINNLGANFDPCRFASSVVGGQPAVVADSQLLVTVNDQEASANNKKASDLAGEWATSLKKAAGCPTPDESPASESAKQEPAAEDQVEKGAPIISLGSGLRVGMALVAGPSSEVNKVNAVAQIEGEFHGRARIRALVPIDTEGIREFHRVPKTSVIGVADIKL